MNKIPIFISWVVTHALIYMIHKNFLFICPPISLIFISFIISVITHFVSARFFLHKLVYTD